jgi:UDP-N-acetylglucosamine transferase subunit ALG13
MARSYQEVPRLSLFRPSLVILVSVGTQLPFDRLITAVDQWAGAANRHDVIGQIGPSTYRPRAISAFDFIDHDRFRDLQAQCSLMVSHAGMGSIITALELGKPIILLARDHRRGEHRNGHQIATVRQFAKLPGVYIAQDEQELTALLDRIDTLTASPVLTGSAPDMFIDKLAAYVHAPRGRSFLTRVSQFLR